MGVHTRVYEINDDIAINIPNNVLPEPKLKEVEEVVEIPGHLAETYHPYWYYCIVRKYKDRIVLLLKPIIEQSEIEIISHIGLDPFKPLYVHLSGTPRDRWVRASKYHKGIRVNVPADIERKLKISEYEVYPVLLRGTTFPEKRIRIIRRPVREVIIEHMGEQYYAEETVLDRYRWIIPKEIESHPVLLQGFRMIPPVYPLAEIHRFEDIIYVDFFYYSDGGRMVSEQIGYAFRNMAVRNYIAAVTVDLGYPFLCEIRCSYISSMPKKFYQIKEHAVYEKGALTLKRALETCVYNLLQYFFPHAKAGKYSSVSYAEHMGKIEFTTEKVDLQRRYPRLRNVPRIISLGETTMEPWDIIEYPYYKAIKYIRIINEDCYKAQEFTRYIYTNDDVERVLYQNEEKQVEMGLSRRIWLDVNGFVWRTFADER